MTERIRWESQPEVSSAAYVGYVGALGKDLFRIYTPDQRDDDWILASFLPGSPHRSGYAESAEELKPVAERLLLAFISSLGAVFRDAVAADLRSHASELEAAVSADGRDRKNRALFAAGMRRAADLAERGDRPAVSTAPAEPAKEGQ